MNWRAGPLPPTALFCNYTARHLSTCRYGGGNNPRPHRHRGQLSSPPPQQDEWPNKSTREAPPLKSLKDVRQLLARRERVGHRRSVLVDRKTIACLLKSTRAVGNSPVPEHNHSLLNVSTSQLHVPLQTINK